MVNAEKNIQDSVLTHRLWLHIIKRNASMLQSPNIAFPSDPNRSRRATHFFARNTCESCLKLKEETSLGAKPHHHSSVLLTLSALMNPIGASSGILVPWQHWMDYIQTPKACRTILSARPELKLSAIGRHKPRENELRRTVYTSRRAQRKIV